MNLPFIYTLAHYRRNNFGQPCVWHCEKFDFETIVLYHGIVGKTITREFVKTKRNIDEEVDSRTNAKRKTGYKLLVELKDNVNLPVEGELLHYLETYLPKNRTTSDGTLLPMLAKVYDNSNNKLFKKVDYYIGQWKINGLRCFISVEHNPNDLFKKYSLKFQSREGTYWKSLANLEDYLLSVIDEKVLAMMAEEHYILDGEVYLPGHSVNEINHFVKDSNCPENKMIQYWCYDVAIEEVLQAERANWLKHKFGKFIFNDYTKEGHLTNKDRFIILPTEFIYDDVSAVRTRNIYIDLGYEGLILRKPDAEYQYGKRNQSMIKFKHSTDGKFTVIDIYPEGIKRKDIPLLLCRNDINDATFEVHIGGSFDYQRRILEHKEDYIGRQVHVEYGERSGVEQLPFHVKGVMFI